MKELTKIKSIIEEVTGIPDIGIKLKDEELVSARSVYIKKASEYLLKEYGYIDSKKMGMIGKEIKRDRVTTLYWIRKYDHWASAKEINLYSIVNKKFEDYLLISIEKEKEAIESRLNLFSKDQLISFIPEVEKYMQLNKIAS